MQQKQSVLIAKPGRIWDRQTGTQLWVDHWKSYEKTLTSDTPRCVCMSSSERVSST